MTAKDVTLTAIVKDLALTAITYAVGLVLFCLIAAGTAAVACLLIVAAPFWPKMVPPLRHGLRFVAEVAAGKDAPS